MRLPLPALLCCSAASLLLLLLRWRRRSGLWRKVRAARQRQERSLVRMEMAVQRFREQHPSVNVVSILKLPLPELTKKLRDGSLPLEHVFYAYVGKALQMATETNCITEYLQESETQVQKMKPVGKLGLLYGVPVSLKDSIDCQGHDSTLGFIRNINKPVAEDSVVVQVLRRQGAIPFVKTNVPQSLVSYDCNNLIFGQTFNPLLYTRSPGGSTGGEGALIGGGGSILGFGTDLGGSLRFPAAFCGICAFKPTGNRLSKKGVVSGIPGQKAVTAAVGPMAKDVESLALSMRALLCEDMFSLDSSVPPIPFNEEVYSSTQPLRIGYYETDFFTMPSPAMRRAIRRSLRNSFSGHDPQHHTIDSLEQGISSLMERLYHVESQKRQERRTRGKSPASRATNECRDSWPPKSKLPHSHSTPVMSTSACTKVLYFTDRSLTPFMVNIPKRLGEVTLKDFKVAIDREGTHRYHFKALDPEFGTVKEEVFHDDDIIPGWEGKIVAWVEEDHGEN